MAGLHCERRLWFLVNRPEDRRESTLAEFGIVASRSGARSLAGEDVSATREALLDYCRLDTWACCVS